MTFDRPWQSLQCLAVSCVICLMKRAKRSVVWESFEEPKNNAVICTICQKKFDSVSKDFNG